MPFDPISYLEALKSRKLSNLIVDADKDWQGYLIKNLGTPTEPDDATSKGYVDIAATGLGINYYLYDEADADVPAYKKMSITPPNLTEAYVEIEEDSVGDYLIQEWIAEPDGIPVVKLGVYTINFQSEIVGGGAKIRFFFRLYERESGGTENLIVESTPSNRIKKERENVVTSAVLTSDYVMATGSRLVLKLYARWEENRSATVRIYYQGAANSRLAVPTVKEILDTVYAAKLHAVQHGLGGADELSLDATQITSGVLDLARIPNIDWSRISDNFPRAISDLISSAFSRSWISDFFSSPFWDKIPDKPSTFPPSAHAHGVGDISFNATIVPTANGQFDIGTSSYKFRHGYFSGTVYSGDVELLNGWRITEYDNEGNIMDNAVRILNKNGEEIFKVSEDGLYFKGKKIA